MKIFGAIIWQKKNVALGSGQVEQLTIFEHKRLFSIWSYSWGEVGDQMRFHTHAFNSIAITLWGSYVEQVLPYPPPKSDKHQVFRTFSGRKVVSDWLIPRFIPRNYCHRILHSCGPEQLCSRGRGRRRGKSISKTRIRG